MLEHIGLYGLRGGLTGWGMNINQTVDTETVNERIREGQTYKLGQAEVIQGRPGHHPGDVGRHGAHRPASGRGPRWRGHRG